MAEFVAYILFEHHRPVCPANKLKSSFCTVGCPSAPTLLPQDIRLPLLLEPTPPTRELNEEVKLLKRWQSKLGNIGTLDKAKQSKGGKSTKAASSKGKSWGGHRRLIVTMTSRRRRKGMRRPKMRLKRANGGRTHYQRKS